ncbi:MAG: DnaD domain protein [Acutalibacteraceae bacterium]|nr:DnaD domain protein [Acutalibacteraceae bacterium]
MNSIINTEVFANTFSFPADAVDKHIKLVSDVQLKVLLYIFRHSSEELDATAISEALGTDENQVTDAIGYWCSTGILKRQTANQKTSVNNENKSARMQSNKPTREEIARLGSNDTKLQFLLREAQSLFARPLRQNESSTLAWLYSDEGMDVSVILMLLQYAMREQKLSTRFIEKTAIEWIDGGVETISDAEEKMASLLKEKQCVNIVFSAFGIKDRKPTKKETELSVLWIEQYKYDRKILEKAYEICVDTTSNFSFPYIKKIIEKWYKDGVKTVDDIKENTKPEKKTENSFAAYDKNLIKKLLEED